jgi:hypothetical protein
VALVVITAATAVALATLAAAGVHDCQRYLPMVYRSSPLERGTYIIDECPWVTRRRQSLDHVEWTGHATRRAGGGHTFIQ